MNLTHFKPYNKQELLSLVRLRRFETKLGARVEVVVDTEDIAAAIKNLSAKYVVLGIPEDMIKDRDANED